MKMNRFDLILRQYGPIHITSKKFYHHRISRLFQPINIIPKDAVLKKDDSISLSQKLMIDSGILRARGNGMFALLPLGQRALAKLTALVDEEMQEIGGQRLLLPTLTAGHLWKKTGRWESTGEELMKVKDRHDKDYVISPTHEEAIVDMLAENPLSYKQLPLRLYQISSKFRDEANARFGLLRSKEFLMKDLYTFDKDEASAVSTYNEICKAYDNIFERIGVPYIKVTGDCGNIGGSLSHEYHYPATIGQDTLLTCGSCGAATNSELLTGPKTTTCASCGGTVKTTKGIEVGHTFLLGTKYSDPLQCFFQNKNGNSLLQMGCYGIGISRVLAGVVEVLSCKNAIKWPWIIAPYKVCIISPKRGSKEARATSWVEFLAKTIECLPEYDDDVIIDDRDHLTIGKRVFEARMTGYPIIVVVGRQACQSVPLFEVMDNIKNDKQNYTQSQLISYLKCK